jgi:hypothetical protein
MDVMLSGPELGVRALWAKFRDELEAIKTPVLEHTILHADTRLTRALYTYELGLRIQRRSARTR